MPFHPNKKKKMKKRKIPTKEAFSSYENVELIPIKDGLVAEIAKLFENTPGVNVQIEEVYEDSIVISSSTTDFLDEVDSSLEDIVELPCAEAVESPTQEQRSDLPDSAFAAVFEDSKGRKRRILPHHINDVESSDETKSVDVPRLRNALARFNQLKDVPRNVKADALEHINAHAKSLKIGNAAERVYYNTLTLEDDVYHVISYTESDDGFVLGDPELVQAHLSYSGPFAEEEPATEQINESEPMEKNEALEDVILLEEVEPDKNERATAPNGKEFLAVLEGRGAVAGVINKNRRLYTPPAMKENVERITARIARAFEHGAAENNMDIIPGEADHPGMFEGPRLSATCTQLLDCSMDGNDVRVKFGLMDTSSGRDMLALKEYGFPLGVSTRSFGEQEVKTMDEDNPFFDSNKDFDGQEYAEIGNFELEAFDLVVHPSAGVFIGENTGSMTQELIESYQRITGDTTQFKLDSSITKMINERENTDKMDKAVLAEQLKDLTVEDLKELVPQLCNEIEEAAAVAAVEGFKAVAEQEQAEVASKTEETESEVVKELREAKAELTATKEIVGKLVAEKENAERQAALVAAIDEAVQGVSYGEACKSFLNEMLLDNPEAKAEDVAGLVERFKENILPKFPSAPTEEPTGEAKKSADNGLNDVIRQYSDLGINKPIS